MTVSSKPAPRTPTSRRGGRSAGKNRRRDSTRHVHIANPATTAALALNMIWQLLIVIVLPIVGGYALDTHFDTSPVWMCVGMAVGVAGMIVVVWQTMRQVDELNRAAEKANASDTDEEEQK